MTAELTKIKNDAYKSEEYILVPSVDIYETVNEFVITAEMPGVDKDGIDITLDNNELEINGKINVSPKFIISPTALQETFGDVFDPETFDKDLQGRFFSFALGNKRNFKVKNEFFQMKNIEEKSEEYSKKVLDQLLMQENITTGLIVGPRFKYYPVSIDRFINEILEREFNV